MTLRSLASLLALCPTTALAAQFDVVEEAWAQNRTNDRFPGLHPIEVEAFPDGGVLVVSVARELPTTASDLPGEVTLTKLDENGDLVWSDFVDSPPFPNSFTRGRFADAAITDQGEVYFVWSTPGNSFVRRYGSDGTALWTETLLNPPGQLDYVVKHVSVAPSGDVITVGVSQVATYPRIAVRTFAPDSTLLWEWRGVNDTGLPTVADATGVALGPGGEIYLHGGSDFVNFSHWGVLIALDPAGNFQWRHDAFDAASFPNAALDSQGNVVVATRSFGGILVEKFAPDGTVVFSDTHDEPGAFLVGSTVGIDAFDRIYVGGSRWVSGGVVGAANLFRFDAAGTYLGRSQPSVVDPGEDGNLTALHVTERDEIVAFGYSGTGLGEMIAARFTPTGAERWAFERRGRRPRFAST